MTTSNKLILSIKNLLKFPINAIINANNKKIILIGTAEGKKNKPVKKNILPICFDFSSLKNSNKSFLENNTIY